MLALSPEQEARGKLPMETHVLGNTISEGNSPNIGRFPLTCYCVSGTGSEGKFMLCYPNKILAIDTF